MATTKPTKPISTLPTTFGGTKTAYSASRISSGYEANVEEIIDGGNLNYSLAGTFERLEYLTTIADVLNATPVGKTVVVDSNNKYDYEQFTPYSEYQVAIASKSNKDLSNLDEDGKAVLRGLSGWNLFDHKWTDKLLNDQRWLRADTFSWQDGTVYKEAYDNLVDAIDGKTATTETIYGITITYYQADDGHKIVDVANVSAVENLYTATGVAWYYILDTTNQRFKLPRTKWGFVGLRDGVGKYVPAGLPNITGTVSSGGVYSTYDVSGAFTGSTNGGGSGATHGSAYNEQVQHTIFDASKSNSIYGNSTTVQQPSTQQYLYFYVGQFSQTATEQTAGLNSSLFNGKVDLDLDNINPSANAKSYFAGIGMPSNSYDNLTVGASGTTYTAPANGYFQASFNTDSSGFHYIHFVSGHLGTTFFDMTNSINGLLMYLPVLKGSTFLLSYGGVTFDNLKFIYAQGES